MGKIIEVTGLKKSYGEVRAVRGIDFYVDAGSLFAFLGVNGAGKSTTIDILSTMLAQDEGHVTIGGHALGRDDQKIREIIGIVYQDSLLDALLTVQENLSIRGSFYGLAKEDLRKAVSRAAKIVNITDILGRPYGKLSGGQRRRADIARALINTPKILFLDEPTTGLDPESRESLWQTLREIQKDTGMTVFFTTHYMEEASSANFITMIHRGQIVARGTPAELKDTYSSDFLRIVPKNPEEMAAHLNAANIVFTTEAGVFAIAIGTTTEAIPIIEAQKANIASFEVLMGTLDDVFINITNAQDKGVGK
ncbi:MAG: ABC transporter ATP-binding protein [Defluviitaleaceae bacterium]|nr:ABC transporter ATP-binding protein [Defluviitaleaceae bacterium]